MALEFIGIPTLEWKKIRRETDDGEEVEIEVLCVCIEIENKGDDDETTTITFRGYTPDTGTPHKGDREDELCTMKVKIPAHHKVTRCCCDYTRTVFGIASHGGRLVVEGSGMEKEATTEGTKLTVPSADKHK